MKILFVDDQPKSKVNHAIYYLQKVKKIDFEYEIKESVNSACRYFSEHLNEIDLAIVDLGLPMFDDGSQYDKLNGLKVIEEIFRKNINIPVIINSTTEIPNESTYLKKYKDRNATIAHVEMLHGEWLTYFIKNNLNN